MNKYLVIAMLALPLTLTACNSTDGGYGLTPIEEMNDADWNKWRLYLSLGAKIAANRLVQDNVASESDLLIAANALEAIRDQDILPNATGAWLEPALVKAGLTNDEVMFVLLVVDNEVLSRGGLSWLNPETGLVELSPRTKELLTLVADALRSATTITPDEHAQALQLNLVND